MLTWTIITGLTSLAWLGGYLDPEPEPAPEPPIPPATPAVVMSAFLDELTAQSREDAAMMRQVLGEYATITTSTWSAIELPCYPAASGWRPRGADRRPADGSPEESYWERVASVLAENYEVNHLVLPVGVASIGDERTFTLCVVLFYTRDTAPPKFKWEGRDFQGVWDRLKRSTQVAVMGTRLIDPIQIVNLIVSTVIQAGVGTVTSLGVHGLIRSMGGERRLARLMRRYKRTGSERVKRKIVRTASRLKGRTVDWAEVERIMAEASAPPPPPALPPPSPIPSP